MNTNVSHSHWKQNHIQMYMHCSISMSFKHIIFVFLQLFRNITIFCNVDYISIFISLIIQFFKSSHKDILEFCSSCDYSLHERLSMPFKLKNINNENIYDK